PFSWIAGGYDGDYAFGTAELVIGTAFLDGKTSVDDLIADEDKRAAAAAADDSVKKIEYHY
ncbi:MAG: hypothetical protein VB036_05680, partial [Propionicimonas sp.]|nr:hypothetical protein [Propionicimonas sp.]